MEETTYQNGDVKLVDGKTEQEGLLKVYYKSSWGYVCGEMGYPSTGSYFTLGEVACRNINSSYILTSILKRYYVTDSDEFFLLSNMDCVGNETNLEECGHSRWGFHDCHNHDHLYVKCGPQNQNAKSHENGDVALVDGKTDQDGILKVFYNSSWGYVCDDPCSPRSLKTLAQTACKNLGFKGSVGESVGRVSGKELSDGSGGFFLLDDVNCTGSESNLAECGHKRWGDHNCGMNDHVYVYCNATGMDGDVTLSDGENSYEGILQVYHSGRRGYVCDDKFDSIDAEVVCRSQHRSLMSFRTGMRAKTIGAFILDDLECSGDEINISECGHRPIGTQSCGSAHVMVNCSAAIDCTINNGNCSHTCVNTDGSFTCTCPEKSYLLDDDLTCEEEKDECLIENGGCSHGCVDTQKAYYCSCPSYLYLSDDNSTCTDECTINNGNCSHTCVNTNGSFTCTCPDKSYLLDDDLTCAEEKDECLMENGGCSHGCVDTQKSYYCTCPSSLYLSDDNSTCTVTAADSTTKIPSSNAQIAITSAAIAVVLCTLIIGVVIMKLRTLPGVETSGQSSPAADYIQLEVQDADALY